MIRSVLVVIILSVALAGAGVCVAQAYLAAVPVHGAAWVPPEQQQPPPGADKAQLDRIEQTLNRVLKLLTDAGLDQPPGADKAPAREPPAALVEALGTCVQCHAQTVSQKKGDGFVLFLTQKGEDGKDQDVLRDDFNSRELRRVIREVDAGTMPKRSSGATLTKDQKGALLAEMRAALDRKEGTDK